MEHKNKPLCLKSLGSRIYTQRKKSGLSQSLLAEKCSLTESYISLIETGSKVPSVRSLAAIASALGTSMDYLVFGSSPCDLCPSCTVLSSALSKHPSIDQHSLSVFMEIAMQYIDVYSNSLVSSDK